MAKGKKSIGKIVLIAVVVLIVFGAMGSMGGESDNGGSASQDVAQNQQAPEPEPEPEPEPYAVADEALDTSNPYGVKITGTLTNNTDQDKSYIQVSYNLYDADGAQVGTALANTNNLKAGGTWKYEAIGTVEPAQVASWELVEVTGF